MSSQVLSLGSWAVQTTPRLEALNLVPIRRKRGLKLGLKRLKCSAADLKVKTRHLYEQITPTGLEANVITCNNGVFCCLSSIKSRLQRVFEASFEAWAAHTADPTIADLPGGSALARLGQAELPSSWWDFKRVRSM